MAFLWIVFGCIFAGAVHDYLSGMLSVKHDGVTMAEIVGYYLGDGAKKVMRVFSVVLLILVGVVFITGPAGILANLTNIKPLIWIGIIIVYYLLATVLPVDQLIGKIYPLFGASLIIMGIGIAGGLMKLQVDLYSKGIIFQRLLFKIFIHNLLLYTHTYL